MLIAQTEAEDRQMTSIAATASDASISLASAGSALANRAVAPTPPSKAGETDRLADTFGPAVVIEISDAAKDTAAVKRPSLEESIKDFKSQYTAWAIERGKTDVEIEGGLQKMESSMRAGEARWLAAQAENERFHQSQAVQQGNMEGALDAAGGAPQSLIDAVRTINTYRYDAGGAGSSVVYEDPAVRDQIRQLHGDDVLQGVIARGKAYDAASTLRAQGSASALARFGLEGSAFTMDKGNFRMASFTLGKIAGGYSVSFDADTSAFKVLKQGEDITAAIFKGTAFQ